MVKRHDVIVVGAGLGGLAAAATLARAGLSVCIFEQHSQPGGYATTFVRRGYEFEVSLHALSGIGLPGDRGPLHALLTELGVAEKVEFLPIRMLYRSVGPGLDVRIPMGREAALDTLCREFPKERRGLQRVMDRLFAVHDDVCAIERAGGEGPMPLAIARYPHAAHAAMVTLGTVLHREVANPRARLAFSQLWGYFGLPPSRLSFLYFAAGLASYLRYGAAYPRGKSQALSNAFVEVIEAAGGRVHLNNRVRRILTARGRATGVIDARDEQIEADAVIVNADPVTTAAELIGAEALPDSFLRRLASSRPSLGSVCTYIALDAPPDALGIVDHETFVNQSVNMDEQYRAALRTRPGKAFVMAAYNVVDPEFSRPGTSVVTLTGLSDGHAWTSINPNQYPTMKLRLAERMIEQVEALHPGFREHIEAAYVSTPLTNVRYTGNLAGAIYGFENTPSDNPAWRLPQKGPLGGLWFAGAWTRPGGGFEPCITSGYTAAREVITALGASRRMAKGVVA